MSTTRQRIIDYLRTKETASAAQIGQALHMTAANARHHLSSLRTEGIVQQAGFITASARGRPVQLYSLVEPIARHNLDGLAGSLLQILWQASQASERETLLQQLAARLSGDLTPSKSPTLRLNHSVQRLNELQYRAHWEAYAPAPRIVLGHCPYRAILEDHPELCRMDALLLQRLVLVPVTHTAKLAPGAAGLPVCVFTLAARPGVVK